MNNLALSETTPVGSIVYKLEGYDPENSNVTFGIINSDYFKVNSITGEVEVIKPLDREVNVYLFFFSIYIILYILYA